MMISEDRRSRPHLDIPLLVVTFALSLFGVYCIAIATYDPDKGTGLSILNHIVNSGSASWQAVFCLASPAILAAVIAVPYEFFRVQAPLAFYAVIGLLLLALLSESGSSVTAWIPIGSGRTIQPSEFIKLAIILMLARSMARVKKPMGNLRDFMRNGLILMVPATLTLMQGETGSVIVMCFVFYVMVFYAGADWRMIVSVTLIVAVLGAGLVGYMMISDPDDYRLMRILSFFDPAEYSSNEGYQVLNSMMAIGSGGIHGIGTFVTGSISQLNYVPEDWTDFIFSAIGEAFGFVGCVSILIAYAFMILRMLHLARYTNDRFGQLVIIGVMAMILLHVVENIGMATGKMPITGIPLPFLSYGGSNFVTNIAGIGLVLNVTKNRASAMAINAPLPTVKKNRRGIHRPKINRPNHPDIPQDTL